MLKAHPPILLATLNGKAFPSRITVEVDGLGQEIVRYTSNMDIDADGANGQHGLPAAYKPDGTGTDILADVGYPREPDEYSQGLICDIHGNPIVFSVTINGGSQSIFASRTALRMPGFPAKDPNVGVDSNFFNYAVVPPIVRSGTVGKVLGCYFTAFNHRTGLGAFGVTADIGPTRKDGEGSQALARALGVNDNPRSGGEDDPVIEWAIYPGKTVTLGGLTFDLQ